MQINAILSESKVNKVKSNNRKVNADSFRTRFTQQLMLVELEPELMQEYEDTFYSSFDNKTEYSAATYSEVAKYLAKLQFAIDALHTFAIEICANAVTYTARAARMGNTPETFQSTRSAYELGLSKFPPLASMSEGSMDLLRAAMNSTASITIVDSKRYAGGKAIQSIPYDNKYVASPAKKSKEDVSNSQPNSYRIVFDSHKLSARNVVRTNVLLPSADGKVFDGDSESIDRQRNRSSAVRNYTLPMTMGGVLDDNGNDVHSENDKAVSDYYSVYKMPLSVAVISVVQKLHDVVGALGNKSVVNALPLSYDFTVFDKMLRDSHPSMVHLMPESGFFFANNGLSVDSVFDNSISIGLRLHLSKRTLELMMAARPLSEDKQKDRNSRIDQMKKAALLKALAPEYKLLSASMMVGYVIDIKPEFVNYITQGHNDKATYILNTWVHNWIPAMFRLPNSKNKAGYNKTTKVTKLSRNVSLPSDITELRKVRDKFGFAGVDSVGDEDGLVITESGTFAVPPRYSEIDINDIKRVEGQLSTSLEAVYNKGLTSAFVTGDSFDVNFAYQRAIDASEDENEVDNTLATLQATTQDLTRAVSDAVILSDPSMHLVGNTSPSNPYRSKTDLRIAKNAGVMEHADVLGYDFSKQAESKLIKPISDALDLVANPESIGMIDSDLLSRRLSPSGQDLLSTLSARRRARWGDTASLPTVSMSHASNIMNVVVRLSSSYAMLEQEGLVPPVPTLVAEALQTVKDTYPDFQDGGVNDSDLDAGHYTEYFDGLIPAEVDTADILSGCFDQALNTALGYSDENLYRKIRDEMGQEHHSIKDRIAEHPAGINALLGLGELTKLRNYFGGALFFAACSHIVKADRKTLFNLSRKSPKDIKIGYKPSGDYLSGYLLPAAIIFGKDIHRTEEYWDKAKEEVAKCDPDAKNRNPEDVKIYGSKGFQYFPHQWSATKMLMGFPEFAILDIAPGGGKTILGLTDMMALASAMIDEGKRLRPVVVAPNGLVKNWCTDIKLATKNWNVIPIRTDTLERWNMDSLVKLITNSPPNTIVVVANSFISNSHQAVMVNIGGADVRISSTTEFVTKLGFNYAILDESHKAKNLKANINKSLRKIFNAPTMLYKRIATGTLYPDRVRDAIGQASLLSPAILGTRPKALATVTNDNGDVVEVELTLDQIDNIKNDNERAAAMRAAGKAIRNRLDAYTALVTKRKKDWSYILPSKIDAFILVKLQDDDIPDSDLHEQAYQQVVADANETLASEASRREKENKAKAKRIKTKLDAAEDDEDEEGDEEEEEDDDSEFDPDTAGMDSKFAKLYAQNGGSLVRSKFDSLEMLITAPAKHETALTIWREAGKDITKFVSSKLVAMIERIDLHFKVTDYDKDKFDKEGSGGVRFNWVEGCEPYELDICSYKGQLYLARKQPPQIGEDGKAKQDDLISRRRLPPSMIPPDQDLDYWKPERMGKIIIISRFHSTIVAVYNALPQKYKAQAVQFHGNQSKSKNERALDQFNNDPKINIIIAMEASITEGYNMQAGSRMIRIDNPWNSGTYEQTISRIMRPDHKGYNFEGGREGDMEREVINVDWIMADGTIDVGKVANLQQKTIETDMMYEDDNPNYQPVLEYLSLARINLGVDEILKGDVFNFDYYKTSSQCENERDLRWRHFEARAKITNIQAYEFAELRRTNPPVFVDIPEVPPHPTFKIMENLPVVPGQEPVADNNGFGLTSFYNWYRTQDDIQPWPTAANTPSELANSGKEIRARVVGLPVTTEYGNGTIILLPQINTSDVKDEEGNKVGKELSGIPFNKARVRIGSGEHAPVVDVDVSLIYVASKVDSKSKKIFLSKQPAIRAGGVDGEEQVTLTPDEARQLPSDEEAPSSVTITPSSTKADDTVKNKAAIKKQADEDARKAGEQGAAVIKVKDKINQAIKPDASGQRPTSPVLPDVTDTVDVVPESDLPDVTDGVEILPETPAPRTPRTPKAKPTLDAQVMVYNGMVAIYANDGSEEEDDENQKLTQYGFAKFNSFAYIDLHNAKDFFKVIDHLENEDAAKGDLFTLDKPSENRLNQIQYAFEHKNAMKFNYMMAYANREDMVDFFRTLHRKVKLSSADTQLKLYPAFMGDRIRLMVDLNTCPAAKKLINHKYAGIQMPFGKWMKHAPMYINFETTPRKAVTLLNKLATKFDIAGLPQLIDEVMAIKVKPESEKL